MSQAPALLRTEPRTVPLTQIAAGLRQMWQDCCPETPGGDVARALTANFVAVAPIGQRDALQAAFDRLLRRAPCRAFWLLVDEETRVVQAELAATTRCHGTTRDIVLETIALRMPTPWFDQVPGLVRPLLVNDLPNHLYWGLPWPFHQRYIDHLAALCEHTIVDSRLFEVPAVELERLQERRHRGRRVTDLSWLRLRPWRRALAEAFERLAWRPGLPARATLRHGPRGQAPAILLGQWLADRLGAEVQFDDSGTSQGHDAEALELRLGEQLVELQAGPAQLVAHVTLPTHCLAPFAVPLSRGSDGDLLAAAVDLD